MSEVYLKRGKWCVRDADGKLKKYNTQEEALGFPDPNAPELIDNRDFASLVSAVREYSSTLEETE
jgi:hypothetical protein|tara:strand:- start:5285 stop:5479 length:195 start_codon:yes stop_codon:yes gene_type:complete